MAEFKNDLFKDLNLQELNENTLPIASTVDEATLTKQQMAMDNQKSQFFTSLGNSIQEEWVLPTVINNFDRMTSVPSEPITKFTPELIQELTAGLEDSTAVREVIEEAQNNGLSSATLARDSFLRTQKNLQQINADGWSGVTANVLAAMFDPVEWGAIFATSAAATAVGTPVAGAGAFLIGAGKQGRNAYRTAKLATIGGAELAAFESIRAKYRYDIDGNDVMVAAGLGAGITGGIDAATTAFIRAGHRSRIAGKVAKGEELTEVERRFHDEYNVDALAVKMINKELEGDKFIESIDGIPTRAAASATDEATVQAMPKIAGWNMFGLRNILSAGAQTANSELGWIRYTSSLLGMNSAGYKGGQLATNVSASETAEMLQLRYRNRLSKLMPSAQATWKRNTGQSVAEFNSLVSRYVRGIDTNVPAEVAEVGETLKQVQRDIAEEAVKNDVAGFSIDMLNNHPNYMSRIFNDEKIRALQARLGDDAELQISQLVEEAMRKGQPNIEENVKQWLVKRSNGKRKGSADQVKTYISRIAKAYTKSITDPKLGKMGHAGANEMNLEDLSDILTAAGFKADEIDGITELMTRTNIPKAHKRARHRMVLDEGAVVALRTADGSIEEFRFSDLLEEDAEQLVNSYVFQLSGAIGLARNGINTNAPNSSFEAILTKITNEAKAKPLADQEKIRSEIKSLQFMYDGITGRLAQREEVSNRTRDMAIGFRAFSFAVNMGMSGMSAIMELSNVLFEYSFKTVLKSAPEYKNLMTKLGQGQADDELLEELVDAFGLGEEVALGKWQNVTRYDVDDMGSVISPERAWPERKGWSTKLLEGTQSAQKGVAYWSGLTGVTQTLRRMSMRHFTNEWTLDSLPFSVRKRQQLGLSEEMSARIQATIRSDAVIKNANGTVKKLNLDQWDDDVREAFQAAGFKDARQNVQEANIASTNRFMRTEFGKTFFQFLSFTMSSMEQQTQRLGVRLGAGDMAVAKVIASATFMGGLMYATRIQLNAMGRSDADEYIKENMSPERWATGALNQIGAVSLFSYIIQLSTGAMNGNTYAITPPAFSIVQAALKSGKNIWEGDMTEGEYRTLLRILPLQSLYGARQVFNGIANELAN